jgi:hypothetical protein
MSSDGALMVCIALHIRCTPTDVPTQANYSLQQATVSISFNLLLFSYGCLFPLADGMIVIWTPTDRQQPSFGRDPEEIKYDKEFWRAKTTIRCVLYYMSVIFSEFSNQSHDARNL